MTPSARPTSSSRRPTQRCPVAITPAAATTAATSPPISSGAAPGTTTGRVVMSSCSLANVTTDPANDTEPTSTVKAMASRLPRSSPVIVLIVDTADSSRIATSAAAPPPTPLNSATSCGICVICTRRAAGTATTEPTAIAPRISPRLSRSVEKNVVSRAIAAPAAPIRLPRRAVRGLDRPFSARMKQTAATR